MSAPCDQANGLPAFLQRTYALVCDLVDDQDDGETQPLPIAKLAALRGVAPRTIREHLRRLEELGCVRRRRVGPRGLALTLVRGRPTDCDAVPEQEADRDACVTVLTEAGVYPQLARELAHRPWVTAALAAAWIAELEATPGIRNLAAVLVHTLRSPERCLPAPKPRPPPIQTATPESDHGLSGLPWDALRAALCQQLPDPCALWLEKARPLALGDGILVIAVPNALAAEWLMVRGMGRAQAAVAEVTGRRLSLRFVPASHAPHQSGPPGA